MRPVLSVIVPVADDAALLCLEALTRAAPPVEYELVVVAGPGAAELVGRLDGAVTVVDVKDGESAGPGAFSAGAAAARGDLLFFLDPRARLAAGWFEPLRATLSEKPRAAAVQPRLVGDGGILLHAGGDVAPDGSLRIAGAGERFADGPAFNYRRDVDFVTFSCLLVRADAWRAAGSPPGEGPVAFSFAARDAGFGLVYEPRSLVTLAGDALTTDALTDDLSGPRRVVTPDSGPGEPLSILVVDSQVPLDPHGRIRLLDELGRQGFRVSAHLLNASGRDRWADRLAGLGIPCFGADPAAEPADPAVAAAWRKAVGAALPGVLVRHRFDTVLFGDIDAAQAAMAAVRTFAPDATVVVDAGVAAHALPTGERLLALGQSDRVLTRPEGLAALCRHLPGSEIVALTAAPPGDDSDPSYGEAVAAAVLPAPPVEECIPTFDPQRPLRPGLVSIVIPVWNRLDMTRPCVQSLRNYSRAPYEIIVVDNGSTDGTAEWLAEQSDLVVITNPENRGFAAACNQGIAAAQGEWVVLLNNDTKVPRRWLDGLVGPGIPAAAGAVGPRSNAVSGPQAVADARYRTTSDYVRWAEDWRRRHRGSTWETDRLVGFCLALRRRALDAIGGLDEAFGPGNFEDDDLCLRLRAAGWTLLVADEVFVHHEGHASFGGTLFGAMGRGLRHFERKYAGLARGDEAPLLSACLIVKDEEERLPDCLISLRGFVDEVVVVDTGSSDATRELAEAAGCRVVTSPWNDDFAEARNVSLESARGEWALVIDADERARLTDGAALRRVLAGTTHDILQLLIRSDVSDGGAMTEHHLERLVRPARIRFRNRIHEQVVRLDGGPVESGALESLWLHHVGYRSEVLAERGKGLRNERIARAHYEDRQDGSFYRAFVMARAALDPEEQVRCYREALAALPADNKAYLIQTLCGLAGALLNAGEAEEALAVGRRAIDLAPGHDIPVLYVGRALNRLGRFDESIALLSDVAAAVAGGDILEVDSTVSQVAIPLSLAKAQISVGDHSAAVRSMLPVLTCNPGGFPAWAAFVAALRHAKPETWVDEIATLGSDCPLTLVGASFDGLPPGPRLELLEKLAEVHLSTVESMLPILRTIPALDEPVVAGAARTRWLKRLGDLPEPVVAHIARTLEPTAPAAALLVWDGLPGLPGAAMGRLRCHVALGARAEALAALHDVDFDGLTPVDVVFVAAFVLELGDAALAGALLDALPAGLAETPVEDALLVAGAVGADCLERTRDRLLRSVA